MLPSDKHCTIFCAHCLLDVEYDVQLDVTQGIITKISKLSYIPSAFN